MRNTSGITHAIRRTSRRLVWLIPWSNAVSSRLLPRAAVDAPNSVCAPTAATTASAVPDTTVEPMSATLARSVTGAVAASALGAASFSRASDSPVREAWLTKRS